MCNNATHVGDPIDLSLDHPLPCCAPANQDANDGCDSCSNLLDVDAIPWSVRKFVAAMGMRFFDRIFISTHTQEAQYIDHIEGCLS